MRNFGTLRVNYKLRDKLNISEAVVNAFMRSKGNATTL